MKKIISFLIFLVGPVLLFGQKKFEVTFILPDSTLAQSMNFNYYHINAGYKFIKGIIHGNKVTVSGNYSTIYAQVVASFKIGDSWPGKAVYLTEIPATVTIAAPFNEKDPFANCKVEHVMEFNKERGEVTSYVQEADNKFQQMHDSLMNAPQIPDQATLATLKQAQYAAANRRLEYITSHPDSYFSVMQFRQYVMASLPPDILLQKWPSIFPAKFRDSDEGASIKKYLEIRKGLEIERWAPPFIAKDIDNKTIQLGEICKNKVVLLVFWGTWCGGCIAEIPLLKEFRAKYSKDNFEIISVATNSPEDKAREMIKEKGMDWTHILNDEKINNLYRVRWYPTCFVIDKKGKIVYEAPDILDTDPEKMKKVLDENAGI